MSETLFPLTITLLLNACETIPTTNQVTNSAAKTVNDVV